MKFILLLSLVFVSLTANAASKKPPLPTVFGMYIGMTSQEVITTLKIDANSKVLVGNSNNPRPTDYAKKQLALEKKYHDKYPNADPAMLSVLTDKLIVLELSNKTPEISCSDGFCNTEFMKRNYINYFVTRFNSQSELGNFSMQQKLLGDHQPQGIIKTLMATYGKSKVLGDSKKSKSRSLNYGDPAGQQLTIKVLTKKGYTQIEYRFSDLSIFMKDIEKRNLLLAEFESSL